jgi:hypothetical protein
MNTAVAASTNLREADKNAPSFFFFNKKLRNYEMKGKLFWGVKTRVPAK